MNPVAEKYGASGLASVNLLPRDIAERKKMRSVQTTAALAVVIAVLLVGAGFAWTYLQKNAAADERAAAVQEEQAAVAARDAKKPVYDGVKEREAAEWTLAQVGYGELSYAQLTAAIHRAFDGDSGLEELSIVGPSAQGSAGAENEADIYASGVGRFTVTARATTLDTATSLVQRLNEIPGIENVRATVEAYAVDGADTYFAVEATGGLTDGLLTMRLVPEDGISGVAAVVGPHVEEAADAGEASAADTESTTEEEN